MNSDDYKLQAEKHDREVVAMQARVDQARQNLEKERNRIEADISAARQQIDRIMPYKDDNIEHAKEISDWEGRITILQNELERQSSRIEAELGRHTTALTDHQRESARAWEAHEAAKQAEDQQKAMAAANRAQDPGQGSSSDYTLAA